MDEKARAVITDAADVAVTSIQLPGATPEGIKAQLLNIDADRGIIATIIHIGAGATIPAHSHENGSEAHYVLEGDLVDDGQTFGAGAYLTHAAGVVHGPHSSVWGCKVLTIQDSGISAGQPDFQLADREATNGEQPRPVPADTRADGVPPDMAYEAVAVDALPETQKTAPTDDNPTNPTSS